MSYVTPPSELTPYLDTYVTFSTPLTRVEANVGSLYITCPLPGAGKPISIALQPAIYFNASLTTLSVAFTNSVGVGASIDDTLPLVGTAVTALLGTTGTINAALTRLDTALVGGLYSVDATLTTLTSSITAVTSPVAAVVGRLPGLSASLTGIVTTQTSVATTMRVLETSITALAGGVGVVATTLPTPSVGINALLGTKATLAAALTKIAANISGYATVYATVTARLPSFEFTASAYVPVSQVATYITDTVTSAVSTYEAFPFNSFAVINGKYYGAGPAGLFELVGDKDDNTGAKTNVDATVATGHLHFGSEMQKRMSDFFIAMRSSGDITLRVRVDENDPYEYVLSPLDIATLKQRRSLIGKGMKGKYWQFEMSNTDGCDFDFDSFNAAAVVLTRRL